MDKIIGTLKEMKEKAERSFIDNSIIAHNSRGNDCPIPDTESDLEMILELNQAISILENSTASKQHKVSVDFDMKSNFDTVHRQHNL